ncbi:WYL domain-containing protein [Methylophaga sp.]|uniref:WYL domain-containing protein n=1 Tax=Methylophaga sp. TaxID=2024840 RepID=UPI0025D3AD48|nr:WYL domain-containing protein [Methylophaga sp.]
MTNLSEKRQLERLRYIDLCSYVLGFVNRKLLMNRFEVKQAWATKDFKSYQEKSGNQLEYDHALKAYKPKGGFTPIFEHSVNEAFELISSGSQTIICEPDIAKTTLSYRIKNVEPKLENIYAVLRGVYLSSKVDIEYISRTSGRTKRTIAPHTLLHTGAFHYVRAYDYKTDEFRSFKMNRIISSTVIHQTPQGFECKASDKDWSEEIELTIVCNGDLQNKAAIEYDYGLINGQLKIKIKKALLMFFLMDWNIAPQGYKDLPQALFPLKVGSTKIID